MPRFYQNAAQFWRTPAVPVGQGWVGCDPVRRPLLIAALGTAIGNHRTGASARMQADTAPKSRR